MCSYYTKDTKSLHNVHVDAERSQILPTQFNIIYRQKWMLKPQIASNRLKKHIIV